jgi:hypothetical protein
MLTGLTSAKCNTCEENSARLMRKLLTTMYVARHHARRRIAFRSHAAGIWVGTLTCSSSARPFDRRVGVGPTDLLLTCTPAHHGKRDAARPLPRLKMKSEEANCNGRDAVAHAEVGASAPGQRTAA